ncbi:unnamed protein product [Moneuplotes crassus]|uniref:Uncharacterized protein n=1 Tax=Euplotes crassus TaxID=5936 RepID=A0AAD1UF72_EUPCR|nr:unnamed protein product [Moneuplotes crassus]
MELNKLIFPIPKPSYTVENFEGKLFYIPQKGDFRKHKYGVCGRYRRRSKQNLLEEKSLQMLYHTPPVKLKLPKPKVEESFCNQTDSSVELDLSEVTGQGEINIPSFSKTCSPFKCITQAYNSTSPKKPFRKSPKSSVDLSCQIIENFKGFSSSKKIDNVIPCLFLRCKNETNKMLVYFHGNSEDLGQSYSFIKNLQYSINMHILIVEYPGYGVYKGVPNEDNVLNDSTRVIEFVLKVLKWKTQDIIVMDRSIGTGPACYLASIYHLGTLALISPYTSIRGVIKGMPLGRLCQFLVKERFNNSEHIAKVACPTFILHGKKDNIIPSEHGEELALACSAPTCLILPTDMTHNQFVYYDDFLSPFKNFLLSQNIITRDHFCYSSSKNNQNYCEKSKQESDGLDPTKLLKSLKQSNYRFECVISEESKDSFDFEDSFHSYDMSSMRYTPAHSGEKVKRKSLILRKNSFFNL